jgi:hypothetical protein
MKFSGSKRTGVLVAKETAGPGGDGFNTKRDCQLLFLFADDDPVWQCTLQTLFGRLHDLDVVVVEQVAGRMVELGDGQLKIDLGLDQIQLGLGKLGLRVQHKENRFGAELVFALVGMQGILRQIRSHFRRLHADLGLFQRMHGIGDFQRDALSGTALEVLVLPAACERVRQIGLGSVPFDRQI